MPQASLKQEGMPTGPGCFAKCLIADKYESAQETRFEYTGDDFEQEGVKLNKIEIQEAGTKWVKKKADKNCMSANPDDCLVWCLIEQKAEYIEMYEVLDTHSIKNFKPASITFSSISENGGFTDWREVICDNQLTDSKKKGIQNALESKGYKVDYLNTNFSNSIKNSLVKFQTENNLPIGQLDLETLAALGL